MSPRPRHTPTRTCVGCRAPGPQHALLRFRRRPDGVVVPALGSSGAGRGAYCCPTKLCFDTAVKRRGLLRTLAGPGGKAVRLDPQTLWPAVMEEVDREVELLRRSGAGVESLRYSTLVGLKEACTSLGKDADGGEDSRV